MNCIELSTGGLITASPKITGANVPSKNRVFVVGGTGFLGYHAIQEFLENGWEATAIGLPPAPPADLFPSDVRVVLCDLDIVTDEELLNLLSSHTALVYAAGMDDRYTPKKPA
jgi:dihydroflavonol-4-reductase